MHCMARVASIAGIANMERYGEHLAKDADERRHVDDVAACCAQVRQSRLAERKDGDEVELHQVLHAVSMAREA